MNREELLARSSRKIGSVEIAERGTVQVRKLRAREMLDLNEAMGGDSETAAGVARMCAAQLAAYICDASGAPILSYEDAAALLEDWDPLQVQAVIEAGKRLNALGEASVEAAGGN